MLQDKNKVIIQSLVETFNRHNVALLDEFIATDFIDERNTPYEIRGLDNFKKFETAFIKAFPDYRDTVEDIIAEGDKVWVHLRVTGTHTGEWNFMGVTFVPTGKKITYAGVSMWRIANDKVMERKSVRDMLDFFRQLGAIEPTEKVRKLFP